ncbi:MAG: S8 family serine peptidase [Actinomycetota bacterium]|nr:S8 family serine peptidase [Actinomycetota bacterium]
MKSKGLQALVLVTAAVAGYAGTAAVSAWAQPAVPIATGFGPDDGLTRYVLTPTAGTASEALLADLEAVDGVVNAQRLSDGRALVATDGLPPQALEALSGIADAAFSTSVPVLGTVTDPYFPAYGYNLDNTGSNAYAQYAVANADVDAPEGWEGGTGAGAIVAVVDTGYDSDHPELAGALWTNPLQACGAADGADAGDKAGDCHGWNFVTDSPDVDNGSYDTHGATVSGVIGGRAGNGAGTADVAPDVTIMPLVIGSGSSVDMNLGAEAIRYAVDHGADVINASWGGGGWPWELENLRSAIAYAGEHGVLVVAAAGNDSANRDYAPMYPASFAEPALVTVGNSNAADRISGSSAYGAVSVDLFAPGELVFTTWNDGSYRLVSGTSIASPQVAAAYALYRAAWPEATTAELRQALLDDVDPVPALAGKSVTGGRLSIASLAEGALGAVRYTFTSLSASAAGVLTPGITAAGEDVAGDYAVTVGLGMAHEGEIWALADKAISLGDVTGTTDDAGEVTFGLGSAASPAALDLSPTLALGDGRYVLTVQLHRDGAPLGRTFGAPLLVGSAPPAAPDEVGDDGSRPDASGGSESGSDGSGDSGDPGSDGSGSDGSEGPGDPGAGHSGAPGANGPGDLGDGGSGESGGGSEDTGGGEPGAGDSDDSGDESSGDGNSSDGNSGDQGSGGSGESSPGTDEGADGPGDGSGDGSGSGDEGSPDSGADSDDGLISYPGVGPFSITSISPTRVLVAGGTLVTITGNALRLDPSVRIGDAAAASLVRSSTGELVFRVPARVEGSYDVHVFARDGQDWTLTAALTYVAEGAADGDSGESGDGPDGSGGFDGTGPDGSGDAGGSDGSDGSDGSGDGSDEAEGVTAGPTVRTGPAGERLVRTKKFAALGSIWSTDCSVSCTGVAI